MALPVVLFPCALLGSFAGLLIPELTEAHVRGENARIRYVMGRIFLLTLTFSIGVAGVLICFSRELGMFLYGSEEAAHYIRILSPLIPVMYMDSATDAMLKGLGQQVYSMNVNIADASVSVLLVWLLLPVYGIRGYVITIYVTELLNAALSIARLWEITHLKTHVCQWVLKPLLAVVLSTAAARALLRLLPTALQNGDRVWELFMHITLACLCYGFLLLAVGAWRREDRAWLRSFVQK
jgi:stage V sporulation protein B